MIFNDHDLQQIDAGFVKSLDPSDMQELILRLLEDLKEARERLNQNPSNSSRPPGSQEPWIVAEIEDEETDKKYDSEKNNSLTEPNRCENEEDWDVELTEWHLVGPMLLSLICSVLLCG